MKVKVRSDKINIPTYEPGVPEKSPLFFEKRVYQGSSGKVYPIPVIDKVNDHKTDKLYKAEIIENEFVRLVILPEIGGRIFEAQDKTNGNYDFFYKQEVIKPALVGLAGPWISGGVEFNWPQHHRPGTYLPSAVYIETEPDGAKTVWLSDYDPMNRMKGMHGIRIRPDSSLIEVRVRLFNTTPLIQTFLWWTNIAVKVHKDYQSFFPPDVHYVADHAVRAMSSFPFGEDYYYGVPYHKRPGKNDLRRYENIPVPTSYMVCQTDYNFLGGYDEKARGGFIHFANKHIAPGKKQWTWGSEDFGKAWDKNLTDNGGPYFELMCGVYTDNQPDFSYLHPYETKMFSQFLWSFQKIGPVQNASMDLALRLEILQGNRLDLGAVSSKKFEGLKLILKTGDKKKVFENISISPDKPWQNQSVVIDSTLTENLSLTILDTSGRELLAYNRHESDKTRDRHLAHEPLLPEKVETTHELELISEHLVQYRHPTRYPEPYLREAVNRDSFNHPAYTASGDLSIRKGKLKEAERYLRKSIELITSYHPNPKNGEAFYLCGLACRYQDKLDEAYSMFYKSAWNYEWRAAAYYQLATIDCLKSDFFSAAEHLERSLDTDRQNNKALIMSAIVNRKRGDTKTAGSFLEVLQTKDKLDHWASFELALTSGNYSDFLGSSRNNAQIIIDIAIDYLMAGFYSEAISILELHHNNVICDCAVPDPLKRSATTYFLLAWLFNRIGDSYQSEKSLKLAEAASPDYFFPSRIHEQIILEWSIGRCDDKTTAAFGLGNYYFDKKLHDDAIRVWEEAVQRQCRYGILYRNLGIAYWNVRRDSEKALGAYSMAVKYSPDETRIYFEYDQLRKKLNIAPSERLSVLESITDKVLERDDFCIEYAALLNFAGQYKKALELMNSRNFQPWEGGEGQVLRQYSYSCLRLGLIALEEDDPDTALSLFNKAYNTPDNLGEKYHPLQAQAHINYYKGIACKALGDAGNAKNCFTLSANEEGDFIDMSVNLYSEMTYYSALSLSELGKTSEAGELLLKLRSYAAAKLSEEVKIDYFATSLPLILVFEDDFEKRNKCEAAYLSALAESGLGNRKNAITLFEKVLEMNAVHAGAKDFLNQLKQI